MLTPGLTRARIERARSVLAERLPPTPLRLVAGERETWLKCECLQPTGSFKIRGATFRVSSLTARERSAGVVAYSTGNHAQAVAKAASDAGVSSTIVMSPDVPSAKVDATRRWGAVVVMVDAGSEGRRAVAERLASESGATLIPPYDDFDVMAGQASIAHELAAQLETLADTTVYVPVGGGGLIAGVAFALKTLEPRCRVIGVEPELEADAAASFRAGRIIATGGTSASIADAIKVQSLGKLTFPIIRSFVDDIVTVTERRIVDAMIELVDVHGLVVEPGGATALAAAGSAPRRGGGRQVVLLCGGNITPQRLLELREATL